jgi:glutathione S-transferase
VRLETHIVVQEAAGEEQKLAQALNVLEQKLHSRTYLVDDALSLADIIIVCDLVPAFSKVCTLPQLSFIPHKL